MTYQSNSHGFTLIELLVVVTISMVAVGLVGGLAVDGYNKFQAKAELKSLESLILKAQMQSFLNEKSITILAEKDEIEMHMSTRKLFTEKFTYIRFNTTKIVFNKLGLPNRQTLETTVRGRTRIVRLNES